MNIKIFFALAAVTVLSSSALRGQTPGPVVVPAQGTAPPTSAALPAQTNAISSESSLKFLQEMKAANEATLKTQAAQMATLDALQKAAEEIKVYSKRG